MLLDEADQILLDNAATLDHRCVVAMSATAFSEDMIFEKEYLKYLKFTCTDSKIRGAIDTSIAADLASLEAFFNKTVGYARIIYHEHGAQCLKEESRITMTNLKDLKRMM